MNTVVTREHIASILNKVISLIIFLGSLIYFLVRILSYDISLTNRFIYFQLPFLMLVVLTVIIYIIHIVGAYSLTTISIDDSHIKIQNKFFIGNEVILPYKNIHLLTTKQSLFLKFYRAKRIIINSGSRNERAEIDIIIKQEYVDIIQQKVYLLNCTDTHQQKQYTSSNKWLFIYSLLIPSKWIRPIGYALSIITVIVATLTNITNMPLGLVIIFYLISIVISIGLNALYIIFKFFNFSLSLLNDCLLDITYGKVLKTHHVIYKNKINGILVRHDILNQVTRTCRPYLYVAGYKNKNQELTLPLLPLIKTAELDNILSCFLNEFAVDKRGYAPPPKAKRTYYLPYLLAYNIVAIPLLIFFLIVGEFLAIPIFMLVNSVLIINSQLSYRNTYLNYDNNTIYAKRGGLFSSVFICQTQSIQAIAYKNSIFNKNKGIHNLRIYIKSVRKKSFSIGYMDKSDTF